MRKRLHPTRIKSQDMKTGEFAYMDQLIQDGYFPNLWVLPKNYEPPQPVGQSSALPLMPIFNVSPPNTQDELLLPLYALTNLQTGMALIYPNSLSAVGNIGFEINSLLQGVNSVSALGTPLPHVPTLLIGISSTAVADPDGLAFRVGPNSSALSGAALSVSAFTVPTPVIPVALTGLSSASAFHIPSPIIAPHISGIASASALGMCNFSVNFALTGVVSVSAFTAPTYPAGWGELVGWSQGEWGQY